MAARADSLTVYRAKRNFDRTPEPAGKLGKTSKRLSFVVQRHDATRLHYDLRLEWAGVYKSWAVTRGPSLDPSDKRLAVEVEDHPLDYGTFEGVIPDGYGAGTVQLWDRGVWAPLDATSFEADLAKGEVKFVLLGERLQGGFVMVRLKPRSGEKPGRNNWLLIKERDSAATPGEGDKVLLAETSITTGRTLAEIAAAGTTPPAAKTSRSKPAAPKRTPAKAAAAPAPAPASKRRPAAKPAAAPKASTMPDFVPPQLCRLVTAPPQGEGWLHELKLDGYRLQLRVEGGAGRLRTRSGLDWTARFPAIVAAARGLPDIILDGEVVAPGADGNPDFGRLQATLAGERKDDMVFYAFDLLHADAKDLRPLPLRARRAALDALPLKRGGALRRLDSFTSPGGAILAAACEMDMEGIISKSLEAPYVSGRSDAWTKAKCRGRDEFIVGGWTKEKGGHGLGALLVGAMRDGTLHYVGRVGTGFGGGRQKLLLAQFAKLGRKTSPFAGKAADRSTGVQWVEPAAVVEVAYGGWTESGVLRHASLIGLREDKKATEVEPPPPPAEPPTKPAAAAPQRGRAARPALRLTSPDKILWPATEESPAITKADLADHYARFADAILAEIAGRPISILRAPDGITGQTFFQRHAMRGQSPAIGAVPVEGQAKPYMRIDDVVGLAALAQVGTVEIHPWGAMADTPAVPDRLVFDLDPGEGVSFEALKEGGEALRARLAAIGLTAFPRLTGGKGLHLVVPLAAEKRRPVGWEMAKQCARLVCVLLEQEAPERYTTNMSKKLRPGRIFLDYLRNDRLATAIATWSPRARPGAPVAHPTSWAALRRAKDLPVLRISDLSKGRVKRDVWKSFAENAGLLSAAIASLTRQDGR